jgi:hypothetical protein
MRNKLIGLILISAGALPAWGQTLQPVSQLELSTIAALEQTRTRRSSPGTT